MWELVRAGGPFMAPIILCSIVAVGILLERLWTLQRKRVLPQEIIKKVTQLADSNQVNVKIIEALEKNSPLGRVLAAALANRDRGREIMMERVEDTGRHVVHELERFLNTLGTIATISTLLGLFGTIVGMIEIFGSQNPTTGGGNPAQLAHGISVALYNTLFGIGVAIPAVIFYRHFRNRVDVLVVDMESQAIKLIEIIHGERRA
jgi:biopolymer transport protein ExbB